MRGFREELEDFHPLYQFYIIFEITGLFKRDILYNLNHHQ